MLELWAVDRPELHNLTDVLVFSTRGERTVTQPLLIEQEVKEFSRT